MSVFRNPGDRALLAMGADNAAWNEGNDKASVYRITAFGHKAFGTVAVEKELRALTMSRDGKWLGTIDGGPKGKGFQFWKVADLKESRVWKCPSTEVLALSHDGVLAAGCSGTDGKIWVYDTETGKELTTLEVPDTIRFMEFVPSSTKLAFAGKAGVIHIWDARTGKPVTPTGGHLGAIRAVAYTPDGGAVTASADGTARLWDATGKEVRKFEGHKGAVNTLALSADGKTLFTGGDDGTVRAWDVSKGTELRKLDADKPTNAVQCLTLSADGKSLAVGSARGAIRVLAPDTLKLNKSLDSEGATALTFADERLVTRDSENTIRVWDVAKGQPSEKFRAYRCGPHATPLAASPDGKVVASVLGDEKAKPDAPAVDVGLWDTATGLLRDRVQVGRRENEVTAITYLPGGKSIAVGDAGGIVWVIDLEKKESRHVFKGHRGPVLSLAASPDGKTVSSGGSDTTVLVWKLDRP